MTLHKRSIITINDAVPVVKTNAFRNPVNWHIKEGEHWAIIGPNGAGKSQIINLLTSNQYLLSGEIACADDRKVKDFVKLVSFSDIRTYMDIDQSYYQQRWNNGVEQTAPFVKELLNNIEYETDVIALLSKTFEIKELEEKRINMLSSGELRKVLIVLALLSNPQVLILDNPYIGLDAGSRDVLNLMFDQLAKLAHIQIIIAVSSIEDIPPIVTHLLPIKDKRLLPVLRREDVERDNLILDRLFDATAFKSPLSHDDSENAPFETALIFKDVHIKYGEKVILNSINWTVRRGEKWLLTGKNGAGKSTMLSLVLCDNPQAYANDIVLFDKKIGAGRSIWEIKTRIGYLSPELTFYYRRNLTCLEVVASGFFDTIGSPRACTSRQKETAYDWMTAFGIAHLRDTMFLRISTGEQQLVLLARAFVKNPDLLILDEPMHGLDSSNKIRVNKIIENYCSAGKTLIYVTHYKEEIPRCITHTFNVEKQM